MTKTIAYDRRRPGAGGHPRDPIHDPRQDRPGQGEQAMTATARGVIEHVGGLIGTLVPTRNIVGPSLRVGVTSDHRAAVIRVGMADAGLDIDGLTDLIAALSDARTILEGE